MHRRGVWISITAAALALLGAGVAEAKPKPAGIFNVSGVPGQITVGPKGAAWVALQGSSESNELARIKPNGKVDEFDLAAFSLGGLTFGPDGNIWATTSANVLKIPPGDPGNYQTYAIGALGQANEIIKGPGGRLWTASGGTLISFDPANPAGYDEIDLGNNTSARGIAAAKGKVWVADFNDGKILRVKPGGAIKRFDVGGGPQDVATGPKGRAAYTNQGTNPHSIGRIVGKRVVKKNVPNDDPFGITFAGDGNWWIANFTGHNLTILTPKGKTSRYRKLPKNSGPRFIARAKGGRLWVGLEKAEKVARIRGVKR